VNYGRSLENGSGVPIDLPEEVPHFKLSGYQANDSGQFDYGWCFETGNSAPTDVSKAARHFRLWAHDGSDSAQMSCG
jgi:TPR repeat protein